MTLFEVSCQQFYRPSIMVVYVVNAFWVARSFLDVIPHVATEQSWLLEMLRMSAKHIFNHISKYEKGSYGSKEERETDRHPSFYTKQRSDCCHCISTRFLQLQQIIVGFNITLKHCGITKMLFQNTWKKYVYKRGNFSFSTTERENFISGNMCLDSNC